MYKRTRFKILGCMIVKKQWPLDFRSLSEPLNLLYFFVTTSLKEILHWVWVSGTLQKNHTSISNMSTANLEILWVITQCRNALGSMTDLSTIHLPPTFIYVPPPLTSWHPWPYWGAGSSDMPMVPQWPFQALHVLFTFSGAWSTPISQFIRSCNTITILQ